MQASSSAGAERSASPLASGISPRFLSLLEAAPLDGRRVLDVGCGSGRLSFAAARAARQVVGLDRDPRLIEQARGRAAREGIRNTEFHEADVEGEEYQRWAPDLVTAHLCVSDAIVERAARVLGSGAFLGMVAFHVDQWRETGTVSRFAYDEARMDALLRRFGFLPLVIEVDREVKQFASLEEALAAAVSFEDRWRSDGRWVRYLAFLESGGRTLTRSHLIVAARRS
jgi:SAM-dependent methyltransferase